MLCVQVPSSCNQGCLNGLIDQVQAMALRQCTPSAVSAGSVSSCTPSQSIDGRRKSNVSDAHPRDRSPLLVHPSLQVARIVDDDDDDRFDNDSDDDDRRRMA